MSTYGKLRAAPSRLGVLPSLFGTNSALDSPLRSPTPRALSPSPTVLDRGDDDDDDECDDRRRQVHYHNRRASSSSSDDDSSSARKHRTSPDFSSLTPHSAAPNSPLRAPGLPSLAPSSSRSSYPHHHHHHHHSSSSPAATSSLSAAAPSPAVNAARRANDDDDECEDGGDLPTLPMRVPRPKTKADRDRERALGLVPNPGAKREGLGVKLARKRANSLKWAKYANQGAFEVELGLSNDDLKRE
ncbi:hypothetical protein JCM8208_007194 [Rhodotorula glutinis]